MTKPLSRGRPRNEKAHDAILKAVLAEAKQVGFRVLSMDAIAERAGVSKMTIYRWWPNKAAVLMDAFLALVGPATHFPPHPEALVRLQRQLRLQARFFRSPEGQLVKALLGESQFDTDLAEAFRDRWLMPRRAMTAEILRQAIEQGALRPDIDLETTIDLLYGPFYYRLQLGSGELTEAFADSVFAEATRGLAK